MSKSKKKDKDEGKSKEQLLQEVSELRKRVSELEQLQSERAESTQGPAQGEGKYERTIGGKPQYGHCVVEIEPLRRGDKFAFDNRVPGGGIPENFVPAVEDGVKEAMEAGILAGFPVTDVKVSLADGSYDEDNSSPIAFKIAGSLAFKDAASRAKPSLLEPIMNLVVLTPEEYLGDIVNDINSRRGKIDDMDVSGGSRVIKAHVPLAEMFGYATVLRTLSQGRGVFSLEFYRYDTVPEKIMAEIIARIEGRIPLR